MFLLQKTLREDATRCMRNMSAEADCIWRAKRNKSLKIVGFREFEADLPALVCMLPNTFEPVYLGILPVDSN